MSSKSKKEYMKEYNQRDYVKEKKREYMRRKRAEEERKASRHLVKLFLDAGYEDLAYEYAVERAPEMLAKARNKRS